MRTLHLCTSFRNPPRHVGALDMGRKSDVGRFVHQKYNRLVGRLFLWLNYPLILRMYQSFDGKTQKIRRPSCDGAGGRPWASSAGLGIPVFDHSKAHLFVEKALQTKGSC